MFYIPEKPFLPLSDDSFSCLYIPESPLKKHFGFSLFRDIV